MQTLHVIAACSDVYKSCSYLLLLIAFQYNRIGHMNCRLLKYQWSASNLCLQPLDMIVHSQCACMCSAVKYCLQAPKLLNGLKPFDQGRSVLPNLYQVINFYYSKISPMTSCMWMDDPTKIEKKPHYVMTYMHVFATY